MKYLKKYAVILLPCGIAIFFIIRYWNSINQWLFNKLGFNMNTFLPNMTIAERNNNPLNIRATSIQWQGEKPPVNGFENFENAVSGSRAGLKNLINAGVLHGANSIAEIIKRWAPPNENDTASYINTVSQKMGVNSSFEPITKEDFCSLAYQMHIVEAGKMWVPMNTWRIAFDLI